MPSADRSQGAGSRARVLVVCAERRYVHWLLDTSDFAFHTSGATQAVG